VRRSITEVINGWNSVSIPFLSMSKTGFPLHFLHANGYPPECYLPLLNRLSGHYHTEAMQQRPLWPDSHPEEISNWKPLTDDFLCFLDQRQSGPSIAIGHSVGGIVALRAALRQPQRFRALVLIDPVLFPPIIIHFWQVICSLGLGYQLHPLVRAAKDRRHQFDDLHRLFNAYRRKPVFRYLGDPELRTYIEGITCSSDQGYQLRYSVDWEMRIYATSVWPDMDIWNLLPCLKTPLLVIRGAETDTFWASTSRRLQRKATSTKVVSIPKATHLVPLEQPGEVFNEVHSFLQEIL
jgi:pimeloyl-ACP methyl ester carboxylesterase